VLLGKDLESSASMVIDLEEGERSREREREEDGCVLPLACCGASICAWQAAAGELGVRGRLGAASGGGGAAAGHAGEEGMRKNRLHMAFFGRPDWGSISRASTNVFIFFLKNICRGLYVRLSAKSLFCRGLKINSGQIKFLFLSFLI